MSKSKKNNNALFLISAVAVIVYLKFIKKDDAINGSVSVNPQGGTFGMTYNTCPLPNKDWKTVGTYLGSPLYYDGNYYYYYNKGNISLTPKSNILTPFCEFVYLNIDPRTFVTKK
jgi:hypothetical protein